MIRSKNATYYPALLFCLVFYLFVQVFQQIVLRFGPLASTTGFEEAIISGQSSLNILRLFLVLLSVFVMVAGYLILTSGFYDKNPLLSVSAFLFFLIFCLFEIGYRSVELFQVVIIWGKEFADAVPAERALLLAKFRGFNEVVNAIYFPLLFSQLIASALLVIAAYQDEFGKLVVIAMAFNSIRLILRLFAFTPFDSLNIFSGFWYFPLVAIIFCLLIWWALKMMKMKEKY